MRMPRACRLTWRDEAWTRHRAWLTGDYAALLQHEVDHLEGICMSDRGEETQDEADVRSDALGPIRSTEHWDRMKAPGYHLRTSVLPGAKVLD